MPPNDALSYSYNEIFDHLTSKIKILDGVCITGGEPTLHPDLPDFIRSIKDLGLLVKLDTNGTNPNMLNDLIENKLLDYIAMDIKNSPERYGETVGIKGFDMGRVNESIAYLLSKPVDYEFRTTTLKQFHDRASFEGIAQMIDGAENYYIQGFVDRESVPYAGLSAYTREELEEFQAIVAPHVHNIGIRGV